MREGPQLNNPKMDPIKRMGWHKKKSEYKSVASENPTTETCAKLLMTMRRQWGNFDGIFLREQTEEPSNA